MRRHHRDLERQTLGRQDHTTSPSANAPHVHGTFPSTAFRTTFVTTRTPLHRHRNAERENIISEKAKSYFSPRDWTAQISLNRQGKMDFPRTQFLNGFLHRRGGAGAKPN
jgi:hypothetical protein